MIYLFTDFGSQDIYVGQTKAALMQYAPDHPVIDLFHDVQAFDVESAAHLLSGLFQYIPAASGDVIMAIVDPGVGSSRRPVAIHVDGSWIVGPDNGLLSVVMQRSAVCQIYEIAWMPEELSMSFHGRDLFAPVAARLATNSLPEEYLKISDGLDVVLDDTDLYKVIYIDHYGNAVTGIRASRVAGDASLHMNGREVRYGEIFSAVPPGDAFWYENSLGLVEVAANRSSAAQLMGLCVGMPVGITPGSPAQPVAGSLPAGTAS